MEKQHMSDYVSSKIIVILVSLVVLSVIFLIYTNYGQIENINNDTQEIKIPADGSRQVVIVSLENSFDYDSLSSKEKRRNLEYAKTIIVTQSELMEFPSIVQAIEKIGYYPSFDNKGYEYTDDQERKQFTNFMFDKSEMQTGIEDSLYYSINLGNNTYHIDYNSVDTPSDNSFLFVYPMESTDTTDFFVEITLEDFDYIPLIVDASNMSQIGDEISDISVKISSEEQIAYQDYLDSKFEEKYGKGTAPFGINHILFVDENIKERFVVQFEEIN